MRGRKKHAFIIRKTHILVIALKSDPFATWREYVTDSFAFVTLDRSFFFFLMLRSDTRAMGRVLDVV